MTQIYHSISPFAFLSLWMSFSVSLHLGFSISPLSVSAIRHFFPPWKLQTARPTWTGRCSSLQNQNEYSMCQKDRLKLMHTHKLSWINGIASLQAELCLSAVVKGMRLHLNGYEVFLGSRGEQPLMILSWFYPRRAVWQMLGPFDWHVCLMSFQCLLNT